jgi:hypothetical protein
MTQNKNTNKLAIYERTMHWQNEKLKKAKKIKKIEEVIV